MGYSVQYQLSALSSSDSLESSKLTLGERHAHEILPSLPISLLSLATTANDMKRFLLPWCAFRHTMPVTISAVLLIFLLRLISIRTYPCFTGNSNLPLHHVQRPIGVLGGSSKEALVDQSAYLSKWTSTFTLEQLVGRPPLIQCGTRSVTKLTYG